MTKVYQVVIVCYVISLFIVFVDFSDANDSVRHRPKRFLSFRNITHFFLRLNFKANMVPWTTIFAQALGFRVNWDDPPDSFHPYHHLARRTVYNHLEVLMDKNGIPGHQCIRRAICEMRSFNEPTEIYHKILKMVFSQKSAATERWHNVTRDECLQAFNSCAFSMLDVSLYTDD